MSTSEQAISSRHWMFVSLVRSSIARTPLGIRFRATALCKRPAGELRTAHAEVCKDNCVHFERAVLQIPADRIRRHYVKAKIKVHRYLDGELAIFHGHRCLGRYEANGLIKQPNQEAAE